MECAQDEAFLGGRGDARGGGLYGGFAVVFGGGTECLRLTLECFQAQTPPLGGVVLRQLANLGWLH